MYRRDEIDASHYPAFHQMEGVRVFAVGDPVPALAAAAGAGAGGVMPSFTEHPAAASAAAEADLKRTLEGLVASLFGSGIQTRWMDTTFPFTEPSFELEIFFNNTWLEVLGCGVVHRKIMDGAGLRQESGWAFGLGLERLAMVLFSIPDIRLFWSQDARFSSQFEKGKVVKFVPYSKYPGCHKDVSFWLPEPHAAPAASPPAAAAPPPFHENDLCSEVRSVAGDLVETVRLQDKFVNPKSGRTSLCYRIMYRSMDRTLTNEEIDRMHGTVRDNLTRNLGVTLR